MKRILAVFLALFIVAMTGACGKNIPEGKRPLNLYFATSSYDGLAKETVYVDEGIKDKEELAKKAMELLLKGPHSDSLRRIVPKEVSLKGLSLSESDLTRVNLDLEGDYYMRESKDIKPSHEILARYSLISTLCEIDGIDSVKIFINGEDLRSLRGEGEIVPPMDGSGVLMNSPSGGETKTEKFVTLYFTDKDGKALHPETRKATMAGNSIEKTIVAELIKGPVSENLRRAIPGDTEVISVETTEDVCFVNLNNAFMTGIESNSKEEKIAVYSIVNSLTKLAGIDKVQILIDGKKPESDAHKLFSNPLRANNDLNGEK